MFRETFSKSAALRWWDLRIYNNGGAFSKPHAYNLRNVSSHFDFSNANNEFSNSILYGDGGAVRCVELDLFSIAKIRVLMLRPISY